MEMPMRRAKKTNEEPGYTFTFDFKDKVRTRWFQTTL
jgi:hypothetical protein